MSEQTKAGEEFTPATPGPEHEMLKPFAGVFNATVKLWFGPGEPMVHSGLMTSTFQLGGFFLHQDYIGNLTEGPFSNFAGKGYWGYNPADEKYEGFWIDTASAIMQIERGTVDADGRVWTMFGEMTNPQTGGKMQKKSVIRLIDENHNSLEAFFSEDGGPEFKNMEIQYVRA